MDPGKRKSSCSRSPLDFYSSSTTATTSATTLATARRSLTWIGHDSASRTIAVFSWFGWLEWMGVQGLAPFLQKTCPGVIRQLPDRFRALSGKRIVIDGTLITQRFHFAPMPQKSRHVLCWYRLAAHLKESNVDAVCVFDGKQRTLAKEREIERRRKNRAITLARGAFEKNRLDRLHRLTSLLRTLRSVKDQESGELSSLKQTVKDWKHPIRVAARLSEDVTAAEQPVAAAEPPVVAGTADTSVPAASPFVALQQASRRSAGPAPETPPISYNSSGELEVVRTEEDISLPSPPSLKTESISKAPTSLTANVSQLYAEYCQSIPHLAFLSQSSSASMESVAKSEEEAEAMKAEYALSKNQATLTMEEAEFWAGFIESCEEDRSAATTAQAAEVLETRSTVLSDSYTRRTDLPTSATYEDSKEILRAMGVPCIEPSGPFEAEALAAALVLNGHADFVASEDTDVLVYEAPLLRNVTSIHDPLVLISGSEVRTVLDLDRARFIDFALLLGTDFSQRIKNIGPARALKFIREHGSIERLLEHETQYPPRVPLQEYLEEIVLARSVFQTLPPLPHSALLTQGQRDEEEVLKILDKHALRRYLIDEVDYSQSLNGNHFADNPAAA